MRKSKFLLPFVVMATMFTPCFAAQPQKNDTISVNSMDVKKWVQAESTNTKGAKVIKYYCIWKDELVNTSKNTYEKAKLCQQYGAKCALICIGKKQGNRFTPKRITLNQSIRSFIPKSEECAHQSVHSPALQKTPMSGNLKPRMQEV